MCRFISKNGLPLLVVWLVFSVATACGPSKYDNVCGFLPYDGEDEAVIHIDGQDVSLHWVEPSCFTFNASSIGRMYDGAEKTVQVFQDGFWISDAILKEKQSYKTIVRYLKKASVSSGFLLLVPSESQWESARNAGIITGIKVPEWTSDDWTGCYPMPLEKNFCAMASGKESKKIMRTESSRFPKSDYIKGPFAYRLVLESNRSVEDAGLPAYFDIDAQPKENSERLLSVESFSIPVEDNSGKSTVVFRMNPVKGGEARLGVTPEQEPYAEADERSVFCEHIEDFKIGETEVSVRLWKAVMGNIPAGNTYLNLDRPVVGVSWYDTKEFILRLNKLTGRVFRLPTENEWEWAARGGLKSRGSALAGGNPPNDVGAYVKKDGKVHPLDDVASHKPNELGLYDMSGNAWEWVQGRYASGDSSTGVLRGGSHRSKSIACRVSNRMGVDLGAHTDTFGFRLAL